MRMERRKRKAKSRVKWGRLVVGGGVLVLVVCGVVGLMTLNRGRDGDGKVESEEQETSVKIVDENAGGVVSMRVKEFVGRLESDLAYEGYRISRVVLPYQKTREVDVYLEGREEYYKLSVDRGSAVSAEDVGRMARYLDGKGIVAEYVDIRVERKAFYR